MTHETDPEKDAFLAELAAVCEKHGLSLSHEDEHGAFLVVPYHSDFSAWVSQAYRPLTNEERAAEWAALVARQQAERAC